MRHHRYKFSHEHLDYVKVRRSTWQLIGRGALYFLGSILLAALYYVVYSSFGNMPNENRLKRENTMLLKQYAQLNGEFNNLEIVLNGIAARDSQIYRTIFQANPPNSINLGGIGGGNRYKELETYDNSDLIIMTHQRLKNLVDRSKEQAKIIDDIIVLAKDKEVECKNFPAIQPLRNKDLTRTGSSLGIRIHPFYKIPRMHTGIDLIAPTGVDVMATGGGTVTEANYTPNGYGNKVVIDHGNGYTSLYAHLNTIKVTKGQKVKRGQKIATVGNTGLSMAPHLHYEVLKNNVHQDPLNFFFVDLTPDEYERMIQLATNSGQSLD